VYVRDTRRVAGRQTVDSDGNRESRWAELGVQYSPGREDVLVIQWSLFVSGRQRTSTWTRGRVSPRHFSGGGARDEAVRS
jgi:hypothetical protein